MKKTILFMACLLAASGFIQAESDPAFGDYFINSTLRVDYYHLGDASTEIVSLDQICQYGVWAGSRNHLIDRLNNGLYCAKVYDAQSGRLIYSKGFNSYCGEYLTSGPAAQGVKKTFHETALIPFPKNPVIFSLEKRDRQNRLDEIFRYEIDPKDIGIIRDRVVDKDVRVFPVHTSGPPHRNVDIVILGEGYTREETGKFEKDLKRFRDIFFRVEPYRSDRERFNINGVLKSSEESGTDEPRAGIFKKTVLNSSFNAMGSERYLLTEDNRSIRDIAAHVPYDAVLIMVNHERYGGGGIYNFYCTFTADTQFHEYIFIHEFGHSFAGLADEYYTSSVAYNDFYPRGVEPLEANITALLDPENLKWKVLLDKGIAVPTPWEKKAFDEMDSAWQKERRLLNNRIAELKRIGADPTTVEQAEKEYARKDRDHSQKVDRYLKKSRFWNKVGVFEGAGYSAEGLFRPMVDCIMFTKGSKPFCLVCEEAIRRVIISYLD